MGARQSFVLLAALLVVGGLLAGCGKKSGLGPPEGEEAKFTYPRAYPAPLPGTQPPGLQQREEDEARPLRVSPFPEDYTSPTKTY